ncbi:MAG TPA: hypothetical protein DDZ40_07270 [Deltaproteobacteria bacterium]|nr:hypothetical protein [Deltaproteobacteria bacterium]
MAVVIQFRRDNAADWTAENPILAEGEIGAELDTDLFKIGNGTTAWNALPYAQRGLKGDKGDKGDTGATGADSTVPGSKGDKGDKGDQGDIGFTGNTGGRGADGYTPIKGIDYLDGAPGLPGDDGADGRTVLNGVGSPASDLGLTGDFYLDTAVTRIYGPKNGTDWGTGVSLIGLTGTDGKTVLNGSGAPGAGFGVNGDFYIDTSNSDIYGPKTGGAWGSQTSLVGPTGADSTVPGSKGDKGDPGPPGADSTVPGPRGEVGPAGADSTVPGPQGDKGDKGDPGSVAGSFGVSIDGAGQSISIGVKQYLIMPFACTITGWHLVGSPQGTVVLDVWKKAGAVPTVADSITGTEKPSLSSAEMNSDTNLSTWAMSVSAGDVIAFNVDSCARCQKLTLTIAATK